MKKQVVVLLVVGALLVGGAYVWVNSYTKRMAEREQAILEQQQEAYARARERRVRELQAELVDAALRDKLGIADQPDVKIRIARQEMKEKRLEGVVEVDKPTAAGSLETSTHVFQIEFGDDNAVQSCELVDTQ